MKAIRIVLAVSCTEGKVLPSDETQIVCVCQEETLCVCVCVKTLPITQITLRKVSPLCGDSIILWGLFSPTETGLLDG